LFAARRRDAGAISDSIAATVAVAITVSGTGRYANPAIERASVADPACYAGDSYAAA
jgi:hypothetical protein